MSRIRKQYNNPMLAEFLEGIATRLKQFREEAGFSKSVLAQKAGISKSTVSQIENRVANDLQISTLCQLATVLDRSISEFFAKTDLKLADQDRREFLKAAEDIQSISKVLGKIQKKIK